MSWNNLMVKWMIARPWQRQQILERTGLFANDPEGLAKWALVDEGFPPRIEKAIKSVIGQGGLYNAPAAPGGHATMSDSAPLRPMPKMASDAFAAAKPKVDHEWDCEQCGRPGTPETSHVGSDMRNLCKECADFDYKVRHMNAAGGEDVGKCWSCSKPLVRGQVERWNSGSMGSVPVCKRCYERLTNREWPPEQMNAEPIRPAPKFAIKCAVGDFYVSWDNVHGEPRWSGPFSQETAWAHAETLKRKGVDASVEPSQPIGQKVGR